ncbi:MAG: GNAT family N-acetyltransferase [Candidatus Faecousia sp.]|nr:GNAT family N-acetyltransferase [Bacillota bacterium]MDY4219768.1 GNAT family N-acetyltransferase [Candidatus Faecousia sp.]
MKPEKIEPLFAGWQETMVWSYLQGCMGWAMADNEEAPQSAQIVLGDFCFFAGIPDESLIARAGAPILVPRNAAWDEAMGRVLAGKAERRLRYAIRKEPGVFDRERLRALARVPEPYCLRAFDQELYHQAMGESWSRDFCALFDGGEDFLKRGLGFGVLDRGILVAGAASYSVYRGGIEIEIDTRPDYRRQGLASACGAALILACLERNLYPSWDAYDLRSVALAEKLGYHSDRPYPVYILKD